jgi:predicted dehydrogenase
VDFSWYPDVIQGADYFRRWHRLRQNSGSLLVHKATHHFDLMNGWLGADPGEVFGSGTLQVYGEKDWRFYYDMTKDKRRMDLYAACDDAAGRFAGLATVTADAADD